MARWQDRFVNIHPGFDEKMVHVVCPDCAATGASSYPCYCHVCGAKGRDVMMLPGCNGRTEKSWAEMQKKKRVTDCGY